MCAHHGRYYMTRAVCFEYLVPAPGWMLDAVEYGLCDEASRAWDPVPPCQRYTPASRASEQVCKSKLGNLLAMGESGMTMMAMGESRHVVLCAWCRR